jgi:serine/threonine protein kinase
VNKPIPFGKYYLLDRINVGGMAEVFRAKAFGVEGFERVVAVKRILPTIAEDTDFITMFIDEAKIAVQLNHANIAQIFDLGKVGDSYFIALEYVHGKDVRAIFDLTRAKGDPMSVAMACYIVMKVCEGLDYAHNKRDAMGRDLELVHRDVSPQNILISMDGDVKLIDFGIAKAAGKAGKTQAGILKGKFGYLSPEQVYGEDINRRSDVFGVGIVLYELLTNERLFAGDSDFSTIEKVKNVEVTPPSSYNRKIPKALEEIVLKALAREQAVRFQTAMELHDELQRFLYSQGESFARRDLSAWMRKSFASELGGELEHSAPDFESLTPRPPDEVTDVAPILEPAESKAVINETPDAPDAKNKNKSTILGMPSVLNPADLVQRDGAGKGRTVPPPPPRAGSAAPPPGAFGPAPTPPAPGRSVPPPPPGKSATLLGMQAIPSVTTGSGPARIPTVPPPPAPGAGRSVPPPPPRASAAPGGSGGVPGAFGATPPVAPLGDFDDLTPEPAPSLQTDTPVNGASLAAAASIAAENTPAKANPVLDMDWDDEELSTQIYDRPEDQMGMTGYESVEGGFEDVSSQGQAQVPTYVPPASAGYGSAAALQAMMAPSGPSAMQPSAQPAPSPFGAPVPAPNPVPSPFGPMDPHATAITQPPLGSRAAQVTQPIVANAHERSRNPLWAALAVAAVVLVCFVGYVFLAKTERGVVQLTTHPADASVTFDGKPVGTSSPFLVTGVVPGEKHVLEVQKEGFKSWSQEVQVQPGQTLQFPVTLQPASGEAVSPASAMAATGGFSLETTPPGAKVYLDGNALEGATPMRVANLVPRKYALRIQLPDYRAHTLDVDVSSGVDQALPRVTLQPEKLSVRISSEPPVAEAVVLRGDERRVLGKTPLDVTLENNGTPWTLEVTRSGFEPYRRELVAEGGEATLAVQATLFKAGSAAARAPRAESREPKQPEPVAAAPVPAPEEPKKSKEPKGINELLEESAPKETAAPKEPKEPKVAAGGGGNGTLRINTRPWSQVFVDGKLIGNTPQMNVSLPEGTHRVTLVNPEFSLKKSLTIQIKAGQVETQIIPLQ